MPLIVPKKVSRYEPVDNTKIIQENAIEPNNRDVRNYVPVLQENKYVFMSNAFYGTGGFRDGSYLVRHLREQFYDARRELAFYKNYTQPVIRAMVDPVFNAGIRRTISPEDALYNDFMDDVDANGKSLDMFMHEVLTYSLMHGVTFIVMDNFSDQPETMAEVRENRRYPYVYIKKGNEVAAWVVNDFGGIEKIYFTSKPEKVAGGYEKRFEAWDAMQWELLKYDEKEGGFIVLDSRPHNLGVVPVIPVYSMPRKKTENILVDPPLYDLAKLNHAIFNKDSEVRDQERAQGFAVFYVQSEKVADFEMGAHNALIIDPNVTMPPGFASPDPQILNNLVENNERLREDLFRIAGQAGVMVESKQAKSGVALQWEFQAQEIVLKRTANICEFVEIKLAELFAQYTNERFDFDVEYQEDYAPADTAEDVTLIDTALLMGLPPKAESILKRRVFKKLAEGEEEADVKDALDEWDEIDATKKRSATDENEGTDTDDGRSVDDIPGNIQGENADR